MPVDVGIWRVDEGVKPLSYAAMDRESRLQQIIAGDIAMIDPRLMVIGREVSRSGGGRIDVLAIDADGNLVVIELKKAETPREVVAQVLDYGSWVRHLSDDEVADIFREHQRRSHTVDALRSLDEAMRERFGTVPDAVNSSHRLIIVAEDLDPSTERIVTYLQEDYEVDINAVFFRVFEDEGREYLTRAWLSEPTALDDTPSRRSLKGEWNGEFYVSFGVGPHRRWSDAKRYGFVSAGGGPWYVTTLKRLQQDDRVWVNVPGTGYVGVGRVVAAAVPYQEFMISENGASKPLTEVEIEAPEMFDDEHGEEIVAVDWIRTVDLQDAVKEFGFFGNQNTVAQPRAEKWAFTVDRLKELWGVT